MSMSILCDTPIRDSEWRHALRFSKKGKAADTHGFTNELVWCLSEDPYIRMHLVASANYNLMHEAEPSYCQGRIVFIPKPQSEDRRPLTIFSIMAKLTMAIINRRFIRFWLPRTITRDIQRGKFLADMQNPSEEPFPLSDDDSHLKIARTPFLKRRGLLDAILQDQDGFLPARGTNTALAKMHCMLEMRMEAGLPTWTAAIDVKGAFDAVALKAQTEALTALGVSGKALNFLAVFAQKLEVRASHQGKHSYAIRPTRGMQQGSPVAPTIFAAVQEMVFARMEARLRKSDGIIYWPGSPRPFAHQQAAFAKKLRLKIEYDKVLRVYKVSYADDVTFMAATPAALERMVKIYTEELARVGMSVAPKKTVVMRFEPKFVGEDMMKNAKEEHAALAPLRAQSGETIFPNPHLEARGIRVAQVNEDVEKGTLKEWEAEMTVLGRVFEKTLCPKKHIKYRTQLAIGRAFALRKALQNENMPKSFIADAIKAIPIASLLHAIEYTPLTTGVRQQLDSATAWIVRIATGVKLTHGRGGVETDDSVLAHITDEGEVLAPTDEVRLEDLGILPASRVALIRQWSDIAHQLRRDMTPHGTLIRTLVTTMQARQSPLIQKAQEAVTDFEREAHFELARRKWEQNRRYAQDEVVFGQDEATKLRILQQDKTQISELLDQKFANVPKRKFDAREQEESLLETMARAVDWENDKQAAKTKVRARIKDLAQLSGFRSRRRTNTLVKRGTIENPLSKYARPATSKRLREERERFEKERTEGARKKRLLMWEQNVEIEGCEGNLSEFDEI